MFPIICGTCGRDINALGQDNVSNTNTPLCQSCAGMSSQGNPYNPYTVRCQHCGRDIQEIRQVDTGPRGKPRCEDCFERQLKK